jgi:Domain of unknown function (DUF4410)
MCQRASLSPALVLVFVFALVGPAAGQNETRTEKTWKVLAGYSALVVQKFNVEPKAAEAGFDENRAKLLQAEVVVQLHEKKLFDDVLDGSNLLGAQPGAEAPQKNAKSTLLLTGVVTDFEPGSRAKRYWVGFGAGAAKLRMSFVFQDAAIGKDLLRTEHQHKFWIGALGGSKNNAMNRTAEGMVKSLVDDIKKNR